MAAMSSQLQFSAIAGLNQIQSRHFRRLFSDGHGSLFSSGHTVSISAKLICWRYQLGVAAGCGDGDGRRRQWRSGSSTAMSSDWRRCNRQRRMTDESETAALQLDGKDGRCAKGDGGARFRRRRNNGV
ncbi:hypothetical protein DM860_015406 [Cuscuta australis]|uniref:Uncharacterized protein n=1 Tax=Cuscuta australis TaxID=267555 RepID=A0A328EAI8_9ASTE|nr:hypothetical protein DM860_015406 [Cuscuta australis]